MPRNFLLNRCEAELLTDLFMLTDHPYIEQLDVHLRAEFGMVPRWKELEQRGETTKEIRDNWAMNLLNT